MARIEAQGVNLRCAKSVERSWNKDPLQLWIRCARAIVATIPFECGMRTEECPRLSYQNKRGAIRILTGDPWRSAIFPIIVEYSPVGNSRECPRIDAPRKRR